MSKMMIPLRYWVTLPAFTKSGWNAFRHNGNRSAVLKSHNNFTAKHKNICAWHKIQIILDSCFSVPSSDSQRRAVSSEWAARDCPRRTRLSQSRRQTWSNSRKTRSENCRATGTSTLCDPPRQAGTPTAEHRHHQRHRWTRASAWRCRLPSKEKVNVRKTPPGTKSNKGKTLAGPHDPHGGGDYLPIRWPA